MEPVGGGGVPVALVESEDLGHGVRPDLGEHRANGRDLPVRIRRRGVETWTSRSRIGDRLQRRVEGGDKLVREFAHETDGVRTQHRLAAGKL